MGDNTLLATLGIVVSCMLVAPPASAQSVAALSAVGFPIIGGSVVELSTLRPANGTALQASARDAATALSHVAAWSVTSVVVSGAVTTLVLLDASGAIQARFAVPSRAASAFGLRAGDRVSTTATEVGTILHKDGKALAFISRDDQRHLVHHVPLASR